MNKPTLKVSHPETQKAAQRLVQTAKGEALQLNKELTGERVAIGAAILLDEALFQLMKDGDESEDDPAD